MSFVSEWLALLDPYRMPPGGNPLTEWGTAVLLAQQLREPLTATQALERLRPPDDLGLIAKKLTADGTRSTDQVTHDDLKGWIACTGKEAAVAICNSARHNTIGPVWFYAKAGQHTTEAWVRPADKCYYRLVAGEHPWIGAKMALAAAFLWEAFIASANASNSRLCWLVAECVEGRDKLVDRAIGAWKRAILKRGGMHAVFLAYHGTAHPFTKYSEGL